MTQILISFPIFRPLTCRATGRYVPWGHSHDRKSRIGITDTELNHAPLKPRSLLGPQPCEPESHAIPRDPYLDSVVFVAAWLDALDLYFVAEDFRSISLVSLAIKFFEAQSTRRCTSAKSNTQLPNATDHSRTDERLPGRPSIFLDRTPRRVKSLKTHEYT